MPWHKQNFRGDLKFSPVSFPRHPHRACTPGHRLQRPCSAAASAFPVTSHQLLCGSLLLTPPSRVWILAQERVVGGKEMERRSSYLPGTVGSWLFTLPVGTHVTTTTLFCRDQSPQSPWLRLCSPLPAGHVPVHRVRNPGGTSFSLLTMVLLPRPLSGAAPSQSRWPLTVCGLH